MKVNKLTKVNQRVNYPVKRIMNGLIENNNSGTFDKIILSNPVYLGWCSILLKMLWTIFLIHETVITYLVTLRLLWIKIDSFPYKRSIPSEIFLDVIYGNLDYVRKSLQLFNNKEDKLITLQ